MECRFRCPALSISISLESLDDAWWWWWRLKCKQKVISWKFLSMHWVRISQFPVRISQQFTHICFVGLFLLLLTHTAADNDANIPENWVEPHAWGSVQKVGGKPREIPGEPEIIGGSCPRDEAHLFYTKLVNFLFDRSKLRENPDGDRLTRTLYLHLTPDLLQRLKEAKTAREIDSVVFEVIEMSREGKIEQVKEIVISVADVITFYLKEIHNSDTVSSSRISKFFFFPSSIIPAFILHLDCGNPHLCVVCEPKI